MMRYTTRAEWGARPPRNVPMRCDWSQRTGFMGHYSAGPASQTPRQIQDFHMDTRGWSDIGYNWLINSVTGEIFEGRGWLVIGAHCEGHNTANIGVCFIGRDDPNRQDVSDAARRSGRELFAEARRRKAGPLTILGHRDRGSTECPGDELYAWLHAGMPIREEDDVDEKTLTKLLYGPLPRLPEYTPVDPKGMTGLGAAVNTHEFAEQAADRTRALVTSVGTLDGKVSELQDQVEALGELLAAPDFFVKLARALIDEVRKPIEE